jgi:glyoxylase-like metal-dependent hydrolase (beta-lactamase superfamily II)
MQANADDGGRRGAGVAWEDASVTEPKAVADRVEVVVPGVWTWSVEDDRIGGYTSTSYAVASEHGTVLIDPLPLADEAFAELGAIGAICLTTSNHQRSSWRLRRQLGVQVHAPALAKEIEEEPDGRYAEGDALPAGLRPIFTPGAGTTQHTFLLDRNGGIAFVPDQLLLMPDGELVVVPAEYAHDVEQARRSVEKLLDLPFAVLCVAHGGAITEASKDRIRAALE